MKNILVMTIFFIASFLSTSCKKATDIIPARDLRDGLNYSVMQLKAIATCTVASCQNKRFTYEAYFKGVVIADEVNGNFYKELYVRDAAGTGAIHFTFLNTGSRLFIGDSVRLNLKGYDVNINPTNLILEIDSVNFEKNIVKFASGANPQPIAVNLSQANYSNYYGELITINNVGFLPGDTNQIYADPIKQLSYNRTIRDCGLHEIIVRTSNYALFAQQKTPKGNGTITGIATNYNGADQIVIRTPDELHMTGTGCTTYHKKDFNDNSITSGGWTQKSVVNGSVLWAAGTFGTVKYCKITGYVSGNQNSENWFISPSINLSSAINPIVTFATAAKYTGNNLEVWVSSNYVSGAPGSAVWTQLNTFSLSPNNPGSYAWTPSGNVSLNAFKYSAVRIAFKYKSTTSGASTYELDDIIVREN
jgi:hypothetical protein